LIFSIDQMMNLSKKQAYKDNKMKLNTDLISFTKNFWKYIRHQFIKWNLPKLEKTGKNLSAIGYSNEFLDTTLKAKSVKDKWWIRLY
jgi:hypothetical protein